LIVSLSAMPIRHVAVLVLYNERKEMLLQYRSADAARLPNYWAFFGGGIEGRETPEEALAREILEELEYRVSTPKLIFTQTLAADREASTKYVFVERYDPSQPLVQHEGEDMKWWRFEDLDSLQIVDHDRDALSRVQQFLNAQG